MDNVDAISRAIANQFAPFFAKNSEDHVINLAAAIDKAIRAEKHSMATKAEAIGEETLKRLRKLAFYID